MAVRRHMFLPEMARWFVTPAFPLAILFSAALIMINLLASFPYGELFIRGDKDSVFHYLINTETSSFLPFVGLCLCSLLAAGMYAEEYEENAAYMRVQRLGRVRYAAGRVMHTMLSAWLCAFLAVAVCFLIITVGCGMPFKGGFVDSSSKLLAQGREYEAFFVMAGICGLRGAFYALIAMGFSVFVPKRQLVLAVPLLCWYFNQWPLAYVEWIPFWLQPRSLYTMETSVASWLSIGEWHFLLYLTGYTLLVAVGVFLLLLCRIRRDGTFGGEEA